MTDFTEETKKKVMHVVSSMSGEIGPFFSSTSLSISSKDTKVAVLHTFTPSPETGTKSTGIITLYEDTKLQPHPQFELNLNGTSITYANIRSEFDKKGNRTIYCFSFDTTTRTFRFFGTQPSLHIVKS